MIKLLILLLAPLIAFADIQLTSGPFEAYCGRSKCPVSTFTSSVECDQYISRLEELAKGAGVHKCVIARYAEYFEPEIIPEPDAIPVALPGAVVETVHEKIPNPCFGSTLRTSQGAKSGCLIVDSEVTLSGSFESIVVYPGGKLTLGDLITNEIVVFKGGELYATKAAVTFRNTPFANDPTQILRGLIVVDGKVSIQGRKVESFYRSTAGIPKGATQATLQNVDTWQVGDSILFHKSTVCWWENDKRDCNDQGEDRTITAINGNTITFNTPLDYVHPGIDNNFPYVLNTTRSVIFQSENPAGVRAHALLHGAGEISINYAMFSNMGRTTIANLGSGNQKGRYALHAHHLTNGFIFAGNVTDGGQEADGNGIKWGLVVHNSKNGIVNNNICRRMNGACVAQETEALNVDYGKNFVTQVYDGNGNSEVGREWDPDPSDSSKLGRAGSGFWINCPAGIQTFNGNIAAGIREHTYGYGFKLDNKNCSNYSDGLVMEDNEAWSSPNGLSVWWVCVQYQTVHNPNCTSLIKNFKSLNVHRWGNFSYELSRATFDGFYARTDPGYLSTPYSSKTGFWSSDYFQNLATYKNLDLSETLNLVMPSNASRGSTLGKTLVCDSKMSKIHFPEPSSTSGGASTGPKAAYLFNVDRKSQTIGGICSGCGTPSGELNSVFDVDQCAFQ